MLTLTLYKYNGKNNVVSKTLDNSTAHTENGVIFDDFDLITPSIRLRTKTNFTDLQQYNYLLLDGKYYFVENVVILATDVYRFDLRLDVLNTYPTEIKNATATVINKENANAYISSRETATDVRPQFAKINFSVDAPFMEYGDIILTTTKGNV